MQKNKKKKWIVILCVVMLTGFAGICIKQQKIRNQQHKSYTVFLEALAKHQVAQVKLTSGAVVEYRLINDDRTYYTDNPRKEGFKEELLLKGVKVSEQDSHMSMIQYFTSTALMIGMFIFIYRSAKKGTLGKNSQMALNNEMIEAEKLKTGFDDIAGNEEAKDQVRDIIDFIKTPDKYNKLGARMPKGIILYGPPGTGKTLMAKAVAKEAGVPFFSVSGSDFVQLYAGVGAGRVRELFAKAARHEKAVIFIDEIDAIGKKRGQSAFQGNDEKDQTLNALLTEMSGFKEDKGVVVIAATNRLDTLDEALLRPGRFDRHVEIGLPDIKARQQIVALYLKDKPVANEVDSYQIAKQTVCFSGAMLENLINEAAIEAANTGRACIDNSHIETAFYTVIAGKEKKDRSHISQMDRKITAYHEAGHALATKLLSPENSITKVTIIPSTRGAGGFSMNIPKDRFYLSREEMIARIKISLAGRCAEEIMFGTDKITTGASNDIEKATGDLRQLQLKYGMDEEFGLINLAVLTGEDLLKNEKWIDKSCEKMKRLYEETRSLLTANQHLLCQIAEQLLEKETLNEKEIASFFE